MKYKNLNNSVLMPYLGYGVYQVSPAEAERCVADALSVGYRLIDTAQAYSNEEGVGAAIAKSGIPREEIFITSKVWVSNATYERAAASIEESLAKLGTDYIDLMLLHQAYGDYHGAYRALEDAYDAGKIRAIGVSNFDAVRLADLAAFARITPAVNQVETHPFWQQLPAHAVMSKLGVTHESWAPFAEGMKGIFSHPVLSEIGAKYGKTPAQVILRALIENDVVVIPKSTHKDRMEQNLNVFDFELSDEDLSAFAAIDENKALVLDHSDPQTVTGLLNWITSQLDGPLY